MREERIGDCRLILGDCCDLLGEIPAAAVIVSDPPYGIALSLGGGGRGKAKKRFVGKALVKGDAEPFDPTSLLSWPCVLFGANHYSSRLPKGGTLHVWDKHCGVGPADSFADIEFFWTSWRCKSAIVRHLWKGILQDSEKDQPRLHPSQKPVAVMLECIRMAPDGPVADPYMGSGSTGVAAVKLGRPFLGIEIDPAHFATACRRIEAAYREPRLALPDPAPRASQAPLFAPEAA